MSKYLRLEQMGILNPGEIAKYSVFTVDTTDILRIVYDRKPGSLLPVSRRYKFPRVKKSVLVDGGTRETGVVYESSGPFREALRELEQLRAKREKGEDIAALIREELRLLEEDIALRSQYINSLIDRL